MSDIAEMMLEGILCELCGVFISETPQGYPAHCDDCLSVDDEQ